MSEETVVGWDGSVSSQRALEWALARAEEHAETVIIARVVTDGEVSVPHAVAESTIEAAEVALEQTRESAQTQHPRLAVDSRLLFGDPVEELRSLSDADTLLVLGTHTPRDPHTSAPWSVGARLAATAYGPVAIVPTLPVSHESSTRGDIVAGVDGSAASFVAARFAASEAVRRGEPLTVVHAWQVPPMWADAELDEDALHALEEVHRGILDTATELVQREFPTLTLSKLLVKSPAMQALHDATLQSRLLVLGNHGLKLAPKLTLGPISHSLVRAVEVPTVIVREPSQA